MSIYNAQLTAQFEKLWTVFIETEYAPPFYDVRMLRGGPALYSAGFQGIVAYIESNQSKRASLSANWAHYWNINKSSYNLMNINFNFTPIDRFKIKLNAFYEYKHFAFEYFEADYQVEPANGVYLMGKWLNQRTIGMTGRLELYVNPEISFQYYANPLISTVEYPEIYRVDDAHNPDDQKRFYTYNPDEISFDATENQYTITEHNGLNYRFTNPNVTFSEFRSNFVFRWEYKPGSVFHLVWSHQRGNHENVDSPKLSHSIKDLLHLKSTNVLMVKFSYWFNV